MSDYLKEELLSSSHLYRGRIVNVRQDLVKVEGGKEFFREVVEHPGAVAIVALNDREEVILVRQYRQPAGDILLEIPAGKLEPGEEPLECARRELLEETGLEGGKWEAVLSFYPSPGFCDEVIHLFLAGDLTSAHSSTSDPEEKIIIEPLPIKEAYRMIESGAIIDGKTIIALQYLMLREY